MKKLLPLLFSLLFLSPAQSQNNFKVVNGSVIWQKVFEVSGTVSELKDGIIRNNNLSEIKESDNSIIAFLNQKSIPLKEVGFSAMTFPIYLRDNDIKSSVAIDFKENKYRVTLSDIMLIGNKNTPIIAVGEEDEIEKFAINKKNEFRKQFLNYGDKSLNYLFNKEFTIKNTNDNW